MTRATVWNLLGEQFVVSEGEGDLEIGGRRFSVAIKDREQWIPTSEDLAFIVVTSFLGKRGGLSEAEKETPPKLERCVRKVKERLGGGKDAVSKAWAICISTLQKSGYLKPGTVELAGEE